MNDIQKYETLISAIPCGICVNNADSEFSLIYANQGYYDLVGYTEQEFRELYPHGGFAEIAQSATEQMTKTGAFSVKSRMIHKTKGYIWVHFSGRFVAEQDGPGVIYIVMIDISEYMKDMKKLSLAIHEEQQFRESVTNDAIAIFEFNLSQDKVIKMFESLKDAFDERTASYSEVIDAVVEKFIHPDDVEEFFGNASREYLLSVFYSGKNETSLDYRKILPSGEYMWVRATTNLTKDTATGDIKGFTYVKDIHEDRMLQLELKQKAESDPLTGLHNKATTESLIKNELANLVKGELHSLLIVDVDNFKDVNDKLGHLSGDIVLTSLADKLKILFRANDIVGRIGGDEFFVFMRNIPSLDVVISKAKEINKAFKNTYREKKVSCTISASIGIALCPTNGNDFETLYKNADIALYATKEKGKNSYTVYDGQSGANYQSARTRTEFHPNLPQKSFKENRVEYLFKLLYGSNDTGSAVETAIELMTDHFNFSRGYIFEISADDKSISNTFEYCTRDAAPMVEKMQDLPIAAISTISESFYKKGYFVLQRGDTMSEAEEEVRGMRGTRSMFHFGIFENGVLKGLIGFDDCVNDRILSSVEIDEMATICNVIAMFITKRRYAESK